MDDPSLRSGVMLGLTTLGTMSVLSASVAHASGGTGLCQGLRGVLTCSIVLFILAPLLDHADSTTLTLTSAASVTTAVDTTITIDFSSAVQLASSISFQIDQLTKQASTSHAAQYHGCSGTPGR